MFIWPRSNHSNQNNLSPTEPSHSDAFLLHSRGPYDVYYKEISLYFSFWAPVYIIILYTVIAPCKNTIWCSTLHGPEQGLKKILKHWLSVLMSNIACAWDSSNNIFKKDTEEHHVQSGPKIESQENEMIQHHAAEPLQYQTLVTLKMLQESCDNNKLWYATG